MPTTLALGGGGASHGGHDPVRAALNGCIEAFSKEGPRVALNGALAYADDIVLLASSPEDLQRLLDEFDANGRRWLLRPSPPKSKVVVFCATRAQWEQKSLRSTTAAGGG